MDFLVILNQGNQLESEFTAPYHYRITTQHTSYPRPFHLSIAEAQLLDWAWTPDQDSCILMHSGGLRLVRALVKAWGTRVIVIVDTLGRMP